ncbi:MFS transporter DHA1 family multidrug resistance protein [Microdochium nivale]|nr:MFS transporter DHA1 family multidrug resistance protein [Microdochium nivale]
MLDHDPEKAAGAASNDTASAQTLHLQTSPSGSDLPRPVEKDAERHLDDGTAAHGSRRTSRDDDNDDDDEDDADEDEDEDDSDVDAIPGRALDRQLSRHSRNPTAAAAALERMDTRTSARSGLSRVLTAITRAASRREIAQEPLPESNLAEGIVAWDSQDDPEMPLNWSPARKWFQVATISAITLLTPFVSSALAPGIAAMMRDLGVQSPIVGSMTVSIYLLGYVVGPLVLAPLADIYGKKIVLDAANISFCLWQIGCGLAPNIGSLIVFRFLAGVGGAGCLTLGGGAVGDMFHPEQRGLASGAWGLGPLLGPSLGPLAGGFLVESYLGWRWTFWLTLILGGVVTVVIIFFNGETNYKVIIDSKIKRLEKERAANTTSQQLPLPPLINHYAPKKVGRATLLRRSFVRPLKLLFLSPIVLSLSIYIAFLYGTLYLLFTTIPTVLRTQYGFKASQAGLVQLCLGLGSLLGWSIITFRSDKQVIAATRANGGVFVPEMRLSISIWFSFAIPVTLFWYGWSAQLGAPWASTAFSLVPFGFGLVGVFMPLTTYLIDCYPMYASSAIAANTVLRSLVGAFLPLAGSPMYASLGLGWGSSLLGFLSVAMIPLPLLFYRFGGQLRKRETLEL